ncbi:ribose/branched-chain amino acids ABC transporter permease [Halorubrum coriense DSM 10284]|uniref:Ribose/branched-chain amino acids ABC transporter permease n=1 Tax=Halorubrum coriense DSM 10284 TaxID=1227466 RepID=M0EG74_9EURY|nr:ABC transporter permease [Halorubrum coriense]ELZ46765.1 ribose/branched-chain amino acids ABC transporter permease [Halorubrum coriense DSM 10284]
MSPADRARKALSRLVEASATERILISSAALVLSVLIGAVLVLVAGRMTSCTAGEAVYYFGTGFCYDPVVVFDRLFLGALGDPLSGGWSPNGQFAITLRETTLLLFTGLSVALAFRAGIFNIGTQGQMVVGALATALGVLWASAFVSGLVGTVVLIPFGLLVGSVFGGLYGAIPGVLKAYADANEVITTIMLNFVATGVALYLVSGVFKDPNSAANQTVPLPEFAQFPSLFFGARQDFSIVALGFGLVAIAALYYVLEHTAFGYDVRTSGVQPEAAEYGGVDSKRTIVASLALSGALAGIAGAMYVMMILGTFQTGIPDYGFDGITVSILAGNNPLGVGVAALLFGVLKSGTTVVQFATDVPPQLVGVLRGLIILFVAMPEFFRLLAKGLPGQWSESEAVATDGGVAVDQGGETDE